MSYKSLGYDNPAYTSRHVDKSVVAAGGSVSSTKFLAFANMFLFSVNAALTALGTSTYTAGGTATVSGMQLNLIRISNSAPPGSSVVLSTTTIGPYIVGGSFVGGGTGTAQISASNSFPVNTGAGMAGIGGYPVNSGDLIYFVSGTDASAACVVSLDWQIQPGAAIAA